MPLPLTTALGGNLTYSLLYVPRPIAELGCWEPQIPAFTHIVGYSYLGHFFLVNEESGEYAVMYPFRQAYKSYGNFESLAAFEDAVLKDPGFSEYVLRPTHQANICKIVGPLANEEV